MSKLKPVSHFTRLHTKQKPGKVGYLDHYEVYDVEDAVVNGRVVKKSVVRVVRPEENLKGLKASDFALENIIAAGATDMLKPTILHDGDIDTVDMIDDTLNGVMNMIDSAAAAEAPKNNEEE